MINQHSTYHVVPIDDLKPHTDTPECWCKPTEKYHKVFVHHAMDDRESYEQGRKLN